MRGGEGVEDRGERGRRGSGIVDIRTAKEEKIVDDFNQKGWDDRMNDRRGRRCT